MNYKARLFNIQKFSIHDGPGIRTVVFFKGCPLKCPWCSNPESQKREIQLTWKDGKCRKCEDCGIVERVDLSLDGKPLIKDEKGNYSNLRKITVDEAKQLKFNCKTGSMDYEGYDIEIEDIITEVKKDMPFYEESGGGVTVSGGEVLFQSKIASKFLERCKQEGIHTAAETTCYCPEKAFKEFTENLDLLLCDIKHWDEEKSKKILGVSLEPIIRNIRYATTVKHLKIICRVPVIPLFNYSLEDAEKIADLIIDLGLKDVNLLPFHNFGANKYKCLNLKYEYEDMDNMRKEDEKFIAYKNVFKCKGLNVK